MKVVKKYTSGFAANIAKGALESAGIRAAVLNEYMGFVTGPTNTDLLAIELAVDDSDYEEALAILNEEHPEESPSEEL